MLKSFNYWNSPEIVNKVIDILQSDKILIAPSDTVIGIFVRVNMIGLKKLNKIKKRQNKPYLILIEKFSDIDLFVDLTNNSKVNEFLEKVWPGPVTVILPAKRGIDPFLYSFLGTVALRLPLHDKLHNVMREVGPLFSTSANKAGDSIPQTYKNLDEDIVAQADLVLCDEQKDKKEAQSSTIIDCTQEKPIIVRHGSDVDRVKAIIDNLWSTTK